MAANTFNTEIPPGIDGKFTHVTSSGHEANWMPFTKTKFYTNAFIIRDGKILLGYKKRGYGKGTYNGFGGKVEPGETSLQAAQRELEEESGVTANLEHAGILMFLPADGEHMFHIDIYRAEQISGEPIETDEMKPEWFPIPSAGESASSIIPFSQMWDTDTFWYPMLLENEFFVGRVDNKGAAEKFASQKWWFGVRSDNNYVNPGGMGRSKAS